MATRCLKPTRTADDSVFLSFYSVPVQGGLEPTDIGPVHEYPSQPAEPLTPVETPTQQTPTQETPIQEPVADPGTTTPTQPSGPVTEPVDETTTIGYSDPAIEMDYYTIGCSNLEYIISYINNKLASLGDAYLPKAQAMVAYYQDKLTKANTAYQSRQCNVPDVVDINNPATVTQPQANTPVETPSSPSTPSTPENAENPLSEVNAVPVIPVTPFGGSPAGAGGGGGGGGGGSETAPTGKKPAPKKKNWWLLAACVVTVAFSVYQSRNIEM